MIRAVTARILLQVLLVIVTPLREIIWNPRRQLLARLGSVDFRSTVSSFPRWTSVLLTCAAANRRRPKARKVLLRWQFR